MVHRVGDLRTAVPPDRASPDGRDPESDAPGEPATTSREDTLEVVLSRWLREIPARLDVCFAPWPLGSVRLVDRPTIATALEAALAARRPTREEA